MNWKKKFYTYIIQRGREYYKSGRVYDLSYERGRYTAKVRGRSIYWVEIGVSNDELRSMSCTCPHAQMGESCKHMAAVLLAIDADGNRLKQKEEQSNKRVKPFVHLPGEYQYYDMSHITRDIEFYEKDLRAAMLLVQEKKVILTDVRNSDSCHHAYGVYQDGRYRNHIGITFDRDQIIRAECMVYDCDGSYEPLYYWGKRIICKHILALMILLNDYLKKNSMNDSTDSAGRKLFKSFQHQHFKEMMDKRENVVRDLVIEPVIEYENGMAFLSLKAGINKTYVVKNLTDFVFSYEAKDLVKFGTKTEIDLSAHRISELSKELYSFVRKYVYQNKERKEYARKMDNYYTEEDVIKNRVCLYGEKLDEFFDMLSGQKVSYTDKSGSKGVKKTAEFTIGRPVITANIENDIDNMKVFHGVKVSGTMPEMIQGGKYRYYFTENEFCRLDEEMSGAIEPVLLLETAGCFSFKVGRNHLSEFYHQVLPILKQYIKVKEYGSEIAKEYIPPEAVFIFYLDYENENITCKPVVKYGEQTVSLLDNLKEDYTYKSFRNKSQEEEVLFYLQQLFSGADLEQEEMHCNSEEDAMLSLLDSGVVRLMAYGEVHTTERFRNINIRKKTNIKVGVSIESDIMKLSITSEDLDRDELLHILKNYQRKKKYYRLKNGQFVSVNDADMDMLSQLVDTLHVSDKEFLKENIKVPVYRALYLNKMLEQSEEVYVNRDKHFRNLIKEFKTVEDSDFEVPHALEQIVRKYQVQGYRWMKTLEHYNMGGILADDMGLGKTLQMITVLLSAKEQNSLGTALIVSPASLVYNWKEEFARFAPDLKVSMVVGTQQERAQVIHEYQKSDILITSYDLLKRDIAEYEDVRFTYQVLDEAQYIKNHGTAAAKSVKVIQSKYRFALTGTPIENRLSELWSIFDYLMPGFLYGYETFRKEYETPIVKRKDTDTSERLKKMVSPFILRRLKGEVLKDLPDKLEEIRYAKLEKEQQRLYDAQVVHMQNMIGNQDASDFQKNKIQILAELTKIRQICCDPGLLFENYNGESAKREACIELIQNAIEGEHKILVFSQFTSMLALLEADLAKQGIAFYKITGETSKEKRIELVKAFNNDDTPVFLISLKAGGTGLNLTGADVVIHYDPWWNLAAQNQATDRAHRIGQEKVVSVYKLIIKDTIEEKIVKMQESKKDLADAILGGTGESITKMSKEDFLKLLGS